MVHGMRRACADPISLQYYLAGIRYGPLTSSIVTTTMAAFLDSPMRKYIQAHKMEIIISVIKTPADNVE